MSTRAPFSWAEIAAQSAALPAPTTSTSGRSLARSTDGMIFQADLFESRVGAAASCVQRLDRRVRSHAGGQHLQDLGDIGDVVEVGNEADQRVGAIRIERRARAIAEFCD